ncbi:MAG: acyl carrier protein [Candidatus Sulfotelmatobacter sp.]
MDNKAALREFIQKLLARKGDTHPFDDEASLIFSGRLQSIDAIDLAVFLEETFGVDFAEMGFDQQSLDTVNAIMDLIAQSSKAKNSAAASS